MSLDEINEKLPAKVIDALLDLRAGMAAKAAATSSFSYDQFEE